MNPAAKDTEGLFIVYGKDISNNREIMLSMVEVFDESNYCEVFDESLNREIKVEIKDYKIQSIWWNKGSIDNDYIVYNTKELVDLTSLEELKKERIDKDYNAFLHFEQIVTGHEFAVAKEALEKGHTVFLNIVAHSMEEVLQMLAVTYPDLKLAKHIIGSLSSDHK